MTPLEAQFLVSPEGRRLLADIAALPGDVGARVLGLRKQRADLPADLAAAAVAVDDARRRARSRFPNADRLFFTPNALAQATSPVLAAYHARYLAAFGTVADLGCGAGMDALALAEAGASVVAVDNDPVRLLFARANAEVRGVAADRIRFVENDVTALGWLPADAAFWDPSRRAGDEQRGGGRRVSRHAERYEPPLAFLESFRGSVRGGCVKLSPALPNDVLDALSGRVEFLSEGRTCKEACVWFGEAHGAAGDAMSRAAVLLPDGVVVAAAAGDDENAPAAGPLGAFVFDPDPAVVRAGVLGAAAERLNARRVSWDDEYLSGDALPSAPNVARLASAYQIVEALPYKPRLLKSLLRARNVARLVVKKRHFPHEPDAIARELGLHNSGTGREATLILVRQNKGHLALVCEPVR